MMVSHLRQRRSTGVPVDRPLCGMKGRQGAVPCTLLLIILAAASCRPSPKRLFEAYFDAANRHDLAAVSSFFAADAVWYLGADTLRGPEEILGPHEFDSGANTALSLTAVAVAGDTVDVELVERNDVLTALGIGELHRFPRFVVRGSHVIEISERRPPLELDAFVAAVTSFARWLAQSDSTAYSQLWSGDRFAYGRSAGEEMPGLVNRWKTSVALLGRCTLIHLNSFVWRICEDGSGERLTFESPQRGMSYSHFGSTSPLVSPDQRRIAFVLERDLWLYRISDSSSVRVTQVGAEATDDFGAVQVLVTQWATDASRILFSVLPAEMEDSEGENPDRIERPADYGFFVYDVRSGETVPLSFPGKFLAWMGDSSVLIVEESLPLTNSQLVKFDPGTGMASRSLIEGWIGTTTLSADGMTAAVQVGRRVESALVSRIWRVDARQAAATEITPQESWGNVQRPTLSPNGQLVAYTRRTESAPQIEVSGRNVYVCSERPQLCDSRWINDSVLAVADPGANSVDVINVNGAVVLGRVDLGFNRDVERIFAVMEEAKRDLDNADRPQDSANAWLRLQRGADSLMRHLPRVAVGCYNENFDDSIDPECPGYPIVSRARELGMWISYCAAGEVWLPSNSGWRAYLREWPDGPSADRAFWNTEIDAPCCDECPENGSAVMDSLYTRFIELFPESSLRADAERGLSRTM